MPTTQGWLWRVAKALMKYELLAVGRLFSMGLFFIPYEEGSNCLLLWTFQACLCNEDRDGMSPQVKGQACLLSNIIKIMPLWSKGLACLLPVIIGSGSLS